MIWPFSSREDNSPDSFERILSKLASQVQTQTSRLALLRQHSRRYKGLFTLYAVIAWILYVVVIVLIVGWEQVRALEVGAIVGGPVVIWSVRKLLDLYYNSKIGNTELKLDDLQKKQRDTVEKLKAATKFSTTQSIIEKYGGGLISTDAEKKKQLQNGPQTPPGHPNGNRQRPQGPLTTPQQVQQQLIQQQLMAQQRSVERKQTPRPNANPNPVQKSAPSAPTLPVLNLPKATTRPSSQQHIQPEEATAPRWYDRLLDVLVGEDETSAKNRYALICSNCRMVNGLAPPGTRTPEEMEGWGCARCGAMNGRVISRSPSMTSSRPSSRPPSRPSSSIGEELVPELETRKSRKARTPVPSDNVRTTRSKVKKEEVEEVTEESEEQSSEEDDEEVSDTPKLNTRVTRGRKA